MADTMSALEMRWIAVTDARGRVAMEARWIVTGEHAVVSDAA